jgi:hypothetical protein
MVNMGKSKINAMLSELEYLVATSSKEELIEMFNLDKSDTKSLSYKFLEDYIINFKENK